MILYGLLFAVWTTFMVLQPLVKNVLRKDSYDVVVLVDSSDDFRSEEFRSEIAFALDLLNIFWGNNTRMGFYTFGGATKQHFALDTHTDLNDLKSAINSIPYSNGNGESLEDAMMHVVENAFSATAGGRLCIPNVLVILTHTGFSSTSDVASLQRAIRAHGVNLVVIDLVKGVGDHGFGDLDDKITVIYKYNDISNLQDSSAVLFDYTKRYNLTNDCATLTDWQSWGSCTPTCGPGLRLRIRTCSKDEELEQIECLGELSEDEPCNQGPCIDCNKQCPPGGKPSTDCDVCECYNVTLIGEVNDSKESSVGNASIFLESRPYQSLGETNESGTFQIPGVCLMNEQVIIGKAGYSSEIGTPTEVNTSHWRKDAIIIKHVAPVFNITPNSAVRIVGQNASLYCSAVGTPMPSVYKWYKDDIEITGSGTDGVLNLVDLLKDDTGKYKCSSETEAGASQTPEALLIVEDCNKQCPPGGKPSADCDVCECYNVTLIGKVNVSKGSSVGNASIFLESRPNQSLGETNEFGTFQISGVCLMNEQVIIGKAGYSSEIGTPTEVNTSHWRIEAIITKHVAPVFNITPSSKVKMVGQNASLFCSAVGNPMPSVYKWYKDDNEIEGSGTDGVLKLVDLSKDDTGKYKCSSETEAGVSHTPEALLVVKDCNQPCPPGGQLSADCEVCECSNVTLIGQVMDTQNSVVGNAGVFFESRSNESLGGTNVLGTFQISGVCLMNQQVIISKAGYSREFVTPTEVNTSHWRIDAIISKHVAPVFNITPSSKVKMVGQNASLYCSAVGNPIPSVYKWYKDDIEIEGSRNDGVLKLTNLSKDEAGKYKCSSETEAGVSQTLEALLLVKEAVPFDVVILLESSDDLRSIDFGIERNFALDLLELFWGNNTRMGFYTFGGATKQHFALDTYTDLSDLKFVIRSTPYSKGNGESLEDAMVYVVENAFSAGGRLCIPNVLVVLTHTGLSGISGASSLQETIRAFGVNLLVIDLEENGEYHDFGDLDDNRTLIYRTKEIPTLGEVSSVLVNYVEGQNLTNDCATLTDWQPWSRCTSTCGPGLRLRFRTCVKDDELEEIDCLGELSEDGQCKMEPCIDPVDGEWSYWVTWSECSKTCDKGIQRRKRLCDEPPPAFGGKQCPGSNNQTRYCADWKCPDCSKACPPGGHLSADCEVCECSSITIIGKVKDTLSTVVGNVSIFLESRPYKSMGETNEAGTFQISGVCIMNEQIIIGKEGYSRELGTPTEVNGSHWRMDVVITKHVAPLFHTIPSSKVRMTGQSASLCCSAVGTPTPSDYKWYKNNIEIEGFGTGGVLKLANLSKDDTGKYKCSSETEAGVSQTPEALLIVKEQDEDTCGEPVSKYETLPPTCFATDNLPVNNTLDVRTCEKSKCITSDHVDNGTCSDWWPRHCCDVGETEEVNVACDGFTYKASRIKTCKCQMCISKTTVSGRAYGKDKGKTIPFPLGLITVNGQEIARTAMSGHFRFDVPTNLKRAILRFTDIIFDKFMEHVKIVNINEDSDTVVPVVIPMKPKPTPFNPDLGLDIPLESNQNTGVPPISRISIPENSTVTRDGKPYNGPANVTVHYMDPRNRDDLEMANGDFVFESSNGDMFPLQTYGIFQLALRDQNGNPLHTTKPIQTSFDSSLLNVSLDGDGNPDLELWHYDGNKGVWVTQGKMVAPSATSDGRRRLLATELVGSFIPPNIPKMNPYETVTKSRNETYTETYTELVWVGNYDKRVTRTRTKTRQVQYTEDVLKDELCYVCVSAYKDFTLGDPADAGSVSITAYSQDPKDGTYLGIKTETVNEHGQACVMVFCNKLVYLLAEGNGISLLPTSRRLPEFYPLRNERRTSKRKKREVKFESRDLGRALICDEGQVCKGPIYQYDGGKGEKECKDHHADNSFRFAFAPFTKEPSLSLAVGAKNVHGQKLSWYPVPPSEKKFRTCFMKIQIMVKEAYDLRVISKSHLEDAERETFGTNDVGPIPHPDFKDPSNRAACVEFRCPGYIKDGDQESFNRSTFVSGRLITNETLSCALSFNQNLTFISKEPDQKGFTFEAESGRNYGPAFGVFINDAEADQVRDYCYSGWDSGPSTGRLMEPDINPAMTFDCL